MTQIEAQKRIEKLRKVIEHHRYNCHVLDKQEISEEALDSLKNELQILENKYPELITADSPTQRVAGRVLDKFSKVTHHVPMISLFDAFSREDMQDWEERLLKILEKKHLSQKLNYYVELKLDGIAASLIYKNRILEIGSSRGDGKIGENITENLKTIESIPLTLRIPDLEKILEIGINQEKSKIFLEILAKKEFIIRGEVIMRRSVFQDLNKEYAKNDKPQLANPRNGAAGSMRQLDSSLARARKLDFYAYELIFENYLDFFETQDQKVKLLKLLGFKTLSENKLCLSLEKAEEMHEKWEKEKTDLDFDCDGLVVKVNQLDLWDVLGVVGKGPRYMMAYKFRAEQATTRITGLTWQVGRTGILTPVAHLDSVNIGGAQISNATLHNMDEIERLDARVGDTVIVERAGDVIPKIVEVIRDLRSGDEQIIAAPDYCPVCKSKISKIVDQVAYRCVNSQCDAVRLAQLIHWASKSALDISGLGRKIMEQLYHQGLVRDVADFYSLKFSDLESLEGFAEKSAENLVEAIRNKKDIPQAKLIYALGIPNIGEETAHQLAVLYPQDSLGDLLKFFLEIKKSDLEEINDIGPIVAASIYNWFQNESNIKLIKKLIVSGVELQVSKQETNQNFLNKSFVITGTLENFSRDEIKERIRAAGGKVSSSLSGKTDFLVMGVKPGSKYERAKKLGVKILEEKDFLEML